MWRIGVLLTVLLCSTVAKAGDSGIVFNGSILAASGYMRSPGIFTPQSVVQPSLTALHTSGLYANVWGSGCIQGKVANCPGGEYDLTAGYTRAVGQTKWMIDLGLSFFKFPRLGHLEPYDVFSPYVEVRTPPLAWNAVGVHATTGFLRFEGYRSISGHNWAQVHVGVRDEWQISESWIFNTKAFVDFYPSGRGYLREGISFVAEASLLYTIPGTKVSVGPWGKWVGVVAYEPRHRG